MEAENGWLLDLLDEPIDHLPVHLDGKQCIKDEFILGNTSCSRQPFSISIAYAITGRKTQGMTLDKAVLSLADREFAGRR